MINHRCFCKYPSRVVIKNPASIKSTSSLHCGLITFQISIQDDLTLEASRLCKIQRRLFFDRNWLSMI